jgi:NDP-sugar pyrophosphorylase family protein
MKGMILAAGEGTRLRPLTLTQPKPMLPVGDRPLLAHIIAWLHRYGVREIGVNLHFKPETVTTYLGDGSAFGVHLTYSIESEIMGTAGGVKALEDLFDETFVVVYGDILTTLNLDNVLAAHRRRQAAVTVVLYRVPNPCECGLVDMDAEQRIRRFVEKPPKEQVFTDLANAGVYILEPGVLGHIPEKRFYDFGRDLFPRLLEEGVPMYGFPTDEYLLDIGDPQKYAHAQRDWAEGRLA